MTFRAFNLRTRRPRNAVQGRLAPTKVISAHFASLNFLCQPSRHNLHGIFADADTVARRKVRRRAMLLGCDWSRADVADIPFADAVPRKRRAKPLGADTGGVAKVTCFYKGHSSVRAS